MKLYYFPLNSGTKARVSNIITSIQHSSVLASVIRQEKEKEGIQIKQKEMTNVKKYQRTYEKASRTSKLA